MIQNPGTTLPPLTLLIQKWWKLILATVSICSILVLSILLIRPKEYLGVSTALPASGYATDRSSIFNENIQNLYSSIGVPDDLDRVVGTARLDTLYGLLVDDFNLVQHYDLQQKSQARYKAIIELKENTRVMKSEYGELKVKVWDEAPVMAAQLSTAFMKELQQLHQALQLSNNKLVLENLENSYNEILKNLDSLPSTPADNPSSVKTIKRETLLKQVAQYETLIGEYRILINTNPQVLMVVEYAPLPVKHDRPDFVLTLVLTFITSLLMAILLVIILEKRDVIA